MPRSPFRLTVLRLFLLSATALFAGNAVAQTVWSGLTYSFTRPNDVDGASLEYQDSITPDVRFARVGKSGLHNAAVEPNFLLGTSPENTVWATSLNNEVGANIAAENYAALQFTDFASAYNNKVGNNILNHDAVVRLVSFIESEDIYFNIHFTSWATGFDSEQPGFAYTRGAPPSSGPTGDYNENGFVDAADYTIWRNTLGSMDDLRANGDDTGLSQGVIDQADYVFWKSHFGDVVPTGAGSQLTVVPEPSTAVLLLGGMLMLVTLSKVSRCGPGQDPF